eukprot:SAG25_NODE_644_length_6218_cov_5.273901_3_plen_525_part_00
MPGQPGSEYAINSRMVQARLRHGSDRWDPPALFYDWKYANDQSALLLTEGNRVTFWGGGGDNSKIPFKVAVSEDSGASWKLHLPNLTGSVSPTPLASQPITTAFRDAAGRLYMGVDSVKATSGLWRYDNTSGLWSDTHGRTVGRHTTFWTKQVPSGGAHGAGSGHSSKLRVMAFGGKNSDIDGYMPFTFSDDDGAHFAKGDKLPFPALGGNQRPCVHRLASGNLVFVGDLQVKGSGKQPAGFKPAVGESSGVYAALSTDDGLTWNIKPLPVALPHEVDLKNFGTLGYSTVRQAPNGVIHILSTMTHPCLHYEINEAWLASSESANVTLARAAQGLQARLRAAAGAPAQPPPVAPPPQQATSRAAGGGTATWSFIHDDTGYALHGSFTTTFPNSTDVEYNATFSHGLKVAESLWARGNPRQPLWQWIHELPPAAGASATNAESRSVFEAFDAAGGVAVRSSWLNHPVPRDGHLIKSNPAAWRFNSLVADGAACKYSEGGHSTVATLFTHGTVDKNGTVHCSNMLD